MPEIVWFIQRFLENLYQGNQFFIGRAAIKNSLIRLPATFSPPSVGRRILIFFPCFFSCHSECKKSADLFRDFRNSMSKGNSLERGPQTKFGEKKLPHPVFDHLLSEGEGFKCIFLLLFDVHFGSMKSSGLASDFNVSFIKGTFLDAVEVSISSDLFRDFKNSMSKGNSLERGPQTKFGEYKLPHPASSHLLPTFGREKDSFIFSLFF
jgi:hypothetical protein